MVERYGGRRLGVFARVRLADLLEAQGKGGLAAEHRLLAWQADPKRGRQVFNKLYLYWQEQGAWYWPLLFPQSLLTDVAVDGVKARALAELRRYDLRSDAGEGEAPVRYRDLIRQLREGGRCLVRGRFAAASEAFSGVLALFGEVSLSDGEVVDYALALALSDMHVPMADGLGDEMRSPGEVWALQAQFRNLQRSALALAAPFLGGEPEALSLYQRLEVARCYRMHAQPREAVQWLEAFCLDEGLSSDSRATCVTLLTDIYTQDLSAPQEAIRVYLACAKLENNPEYTFQAAFQYYNMGAYYDAEQLLRTLQSTSDTRGDTREAEVLYLLALCKMQSGDRTKASSLLDSLVVSYPKHVLAPQALLLLAKQASISGETHGMRGLLERIESEYPDSSACREVSYYLEQLRGSS